MLITECDGIAGPMDPKIREQINSIFHSIARKRDDKSQGESEDNIRKDIGQNIDSHRSSNYLPKRNKRV